MILERGSTVRAVRRLKFFDGEVPAGTVGSVAEVVERKGRTTKYLVAFPVAGRRPYELWCLPIVDIDDKVPA